MGNLADGMKLWSRKNAELFSPFSDLGCLEGEIFLWNSELISRVRRGVEVSQNDTGEVCAPLMLGNFDVPSGEIRGDILLDGLELKLWYKLDGCPISEEFSEILTVLFAVDGFSNKRRLNGGW